MQLKNDTLAISDKYIQTVVSEAYHQTQQDHLNNQTFEWKNKLDNLAQIQEEMHSKVIFLEKTIKCHGDQVVCVGNRVAGLENRASVVESTIDDHGQRLSQLETLSHIPDYNTLKSGKQIRICNKSLKISHLV